MKNRIMVLLCTFILIAGLWMPSYILEWQDQKKMGHLVTETADKVLLTPRTDLTMIEKTQLLKNETVISFQTEGKNYTEETILDKVDQELEELVDLDILSDNMKNLSDYEIDELTVFFYLDMDDSSRSMRAWSIGGHNMRGSIYLLIDDDTGKILTIYQYVEGDFDALAVGDEPDNTEQEQQQYISLKLKNIAKKWGEYLGCALAEENAESENIVGGENVIYAVYEDEHGRIAYTFRMEADEANFSVAITM